MLYFCSTSKKPFQVSAHFIHPALPKWGALRWQRRLILRSDQVLCAPRGACVRQDARMCVNLATNPHLTCNQPRRFCQMPDNTILAYVVSFKSHNRANWLRGVSPISDQVCSQNLILADETVRRSCSQNDLNVGHFKGFMV